MSIIVHSAGENRSSIGLAGQLRWSVLATSKVELRKKSSIIRKQASLIGAKSYATLTIDETTYLGQYTEMALGSTKPPKVLHSLAIVFIAALTSTGADARTLNAIILMEVDRQPGKRAVVIIEGGEVFLDKIENTADALISVQGARSALTSHIVYAQHAGEVPGAEIVTWEQLLECCNSTTTLHKVPTNPMVFIAVFLLILAISGYFVYEKIVVEPARKRAAAAAAAAADTTQIYLAQLSASMDAVGWDRADLTKQLNDIKKFPMYYAGWALEKRECSAVTQSCQTRWSRTGGQLPALLKMLPDATYDIAASDLNTAIMSQPLTIQAGKLEYPLPAIDAAAKKLRGILQRLSNAEVNITTASSDKWPSMDFNGVKQGVIAVRAPMELTAPLPKAAELLAELPDDVMMESYILTVGTGDIGTIFKITLKGHVYAK